MLIPSRTDTRAMHNYVYDKADAVCLIKGRLKFINSSNIKSSSAPFPSCLVIYSKNITNEQKVVLEKYGYVIYK